MITALFILVVLTFISFFLFLIASYTDSKRYELFANIYTLFLSIDAIVAIIIVCGIFIERL